MEQGSDHKTRKSVDNNDNNKNTLKKKTRKIVKTNPSKTTTTTPVHARHHGDRSNKNAGCCFFLRPRWQMKQRFVVVNGKHGVVPSYALPPRSTTNPARSFDVLETPSSSSSSPCTSVVPVVGAPLFPPDDMMLSCGGEEEANYNNDKENKTPKKSETFSVDWMDWTRPTTQVAAGLDQHRREAVRGANERILLPLTVSDPTQQGQQQNDDNNNSSHTTKETPSCRIPIRPLTLKQRETKALGIPLYYNYSCSSRNEEGDNESSSPNSLSCSGEFLTPVQNEPAVVPRDHRLVPALHRQPSRGPDTLYVSMNSKNNNGSSKNIHRRNRNESSLPPEIFMPMDF